MIKTVTKDDLIELGFAPGTARKIIHTGKVLLVNRGFNIYDNKRIGTIPARAGKRTDSPLAIIISDSLKA